MEMMDKVTELKKENNELEQKIETLVKELEILKQLFIKHAGMIYYH